MYLCKYSQAACQSNKIIELPDLNDLKIIGLTLMATNESLLAEVPLFSLLDADERKALAGVLEEFSVKKDVLIFSQGDPGDCLYVVRKGKVEIYIKEKTGERIILDRSEVGDLFGELAIFDKGSRSANALAIEDTEMLVLNREALRLFVHQRPDAALDLLAVMAKRIRTTNQILRGRAAKNPNDEMAEELGWQLRFANFIATYSGSMPFLYCNAVLFFSWITINLGVFPGIAPFDPYPFGLLTMAVSLEAIFLSIFVLLAQNLQMEKQKIRDDIEYDVNLRAELEIAELHDKFDLMNEKILDRLQRIELLTLHK